MAQFAIIEVDEGLTVAECPAGLTPDAVAAGQGGVVVDPGPYPTYEEAYDALLALPAEDEEAEDLQ